ncbi:hypothetical protein ACQ86D_27050 [Streptomyces galilaeus]
MTRSKLSRLAAIGAATLAVIGGSAAPASANSDKILYLPGGRGYIKYHDDGDVFTVCDTKADGHGVTGTLIAINQVTQNGGTVWTLDDGGDSGCGKKAYDVGNLYTYQMTINWHGNSDWYFSEWFNE